MIDFNQIQEKLNMKLAQGFRTVFYIIAKEVNHTAKKLVVIADSKKIDDCIHNICAGATSGELAKLAEVLHVAGKTLTSISESIKNEFDNRFPDEDISQCLSEQNEKSESDFFWNIDESICERFHKNRFIVDEMLSDYSDSLKIEIENDTKEQLFNYKYQNEKTDHDIHKKQ